MMSNKQYRKISPVLPENKMELNEFISTSIKYLYQALEEIEKDRPGAIIQNWNKTNPEFVGLGVTQYQVVDFEVMV